MKITNTLPVLLFLLLVNACDLPHQPGPMPTDIVETEFEPGLNIMGVLRADDLQGNSFININRALTTEEIYSDSIENFSPPIEYVEVMTGSDSMTYNFGQSNVNATDWQDYNNAYFHANAGEIYELEISALGFPLLTAETTIPDFPQIDKGSWVINVDELKFDLQHHPSAYEYRIYLFFAVTVLEKVVKPGSSATIPVEWTFDAANGAPLHLSVTALDENLTRYGNSPISFIPNTYHPDGSTVAGGYGCFGSVSVTEFELN